MTRSLRSKPIIIVQGGQWGSEAKGAVAAALCINRNVDIAVRTGAINAGHSVVYNGIKYAMQQIPTGWVNPKTKLYIGAGAYIHPDTLFREIALVNEAMPDQNVCDRLHIDYRCGIHTEEAEALSKGANRHHSIGATGKGCSEAIVAKIRGRNAGYQLFREWLMSTTIRDVKVAERLHFVDTVDGLNTAYDDGDLILIEGTQGTLLDMHLGPYPYTTSRMTSAANWASECGLSPALDYEVVLVCRTYPIRVAGNSGPMSGEIEWVDLAHIINGKYITLGQQPLVSPFALQEFETKLEYAASEAVSEGRYKVPVDGRGQYRIRMSEWTADERSRYRVAASELHRDAFKLCSGSTMKDLRKLFETTTVTKKLRRLAQLSLQDLHYAVAVNRPAWIALTFMDYIAPGMANMKADDIELGQSYTADAIKFIQRVERSLNVPVKAFTTGPMHENFISATYLQVVESGR